jgi:gas vesicle protein
MGANPDQLTEDIAATRDRMSETADEIRSRVAPPEAVRRRTEEAKRSMGDAGEAVGDSARHAAQDATSAVRRVGASATGALREQPLLTGIAAFGAGLLVGVLAPESDTEQRAARRLQRDIQEPLREAAGESVHELRGAVSERTHEAAEHIRDEAHAASDEVKAHTERAAEDVRRRAAEAGEHVREDIEREAEERTGY